MCFQRVSANVLQTVVCDDLLIQFRYMIGRFMRCWMLVFIARACLLQAKLAWVLNVRHLVCISRVCIFTRTCVYIYNVYGFQHLPCSGLQASFFVSCFYFSLAFFWLFMHWSLHLIFYRCRSFLYQLLDAPLLSFCMYSNLLFVSTCDVALHAKIAATTYFNYARAQAIRIVYA